MKKTLLTLAFICTASVLFAQKDTIRLRRDKSVNDVVTDRPPQALYFQLGGSAPLASVNYDRRFSKRVNGAGFSAGLGFWGGSGVTVFSIPASLNYLIGSRSHFVEIAAGGTFITGTVDIFDDSETASGVIGHLNAGYRYQPVNGGFFFRGGISPLFAGGGYATSFYVGFGHNF
jgi:hypothetical protein